MKKDKFFLIIIFLIFIIFSLIYKYSTGNMLIDFSRESYIPYKMTTGGILYKDTFVIYGIFGYIINYLIYKIIPNFNAILALSTILSFFITWIFYNICCIYLKNRVECLILTFGFISLSIFSNTVFSFVVPYSYSTIWAVFGGYLALYFILKNKNNLVFLSLGIVLANRIEFFIPLFSATIIYYAIKKQKILKNLPYTLIFPLINLIYLIVNNVRAEDILSNFKYLQAMLEAPSLKYLYKSMGTFIETKNFTVNLGLISILTFIVYITKALKKYNLLGYILFVAFLFVFKVIEVLDLVFIPITLYIMLNIKKFTKKELLLFAYGIILSSKSIFKMGTVSYSNFGFFLCLIILFIILKKVFKKTNKKISVMMLTIYIIFGNIVNISYSLYNPKIKIKTQSGTLYLPKSQEKAYSKISEYLSQNLKQNETILAIPEGEIINFIHKKPHNFYNSTFIPLDFETFGEENLTNKFQKNKIDYVIIFPRSTAEYGKNRICEDYGIDFCQYIKDKYQLSAVYGEEQNKIEIYKAKKYEK